MECKAKFYIKYTPTDSSPVDLSVLGESLIGFEELLRQLIGGVALIKGGVKVKAIRAREGSIIIDNQVLIVATADLFLHGQHALEFFQMIGGEALAKFLEYHRSLNDFAGKNPVDYDIAKAVAYGLGSYLLMCLGFAKYQKNKIQTTYNERPMPVEPTKRLHRIVKRNKFKKILKPFIEAETDMSSIKFSDKPDFLEPVEITQENFGDYLGDDQKILPDMYNGAIMELRGSIIALQASRGDTMRFRLEDVDPKHRDLIALPSDGKGTEDYRGFYKTSLVTITAEILRTSLYQKPKLIILNIEPAQREIFDKK
mgnify:CR=1 FL=1